MRRKELDLHRLKLITDKTDRRAEAPGTLRDAEAKRAAWRNGREETKKEETVEKLRVIIKHLQEENKELAAENVELKRMQDQMKRDIQHLLSSRSHESLNEEAEEDLKQSPEVTSKQLTYSICKQWHSLKKHLQRLESQAAVQPTTGGDGDHVMRVTDHEKEIAVLKQEIAESRNLIIMQQRAMQEQLLIAQHSRFPSQLKGSYFLEEQLRLKEDRETLEQQKRVLHAERWSFIEAAIRLGYERKQFEEEQALFLKHQFLNTPSLDPQRAFPWAAFGLERRNPLETAMWPTLTSSNLRVSTPPSVSRSRCLVDSVGTPSTDELYRVLKLTPENRTFSVGGNSLCNCRRRSWLQAHEEMENVSPVHSERLPMPSCFSRRETTCQPRAEGTAQLCSNLLGQFLDSSF